MSDWTDKLQEEYLDLQHKTQTLIETAVTSLAYTVSDVQMPKKKREALVNAVNEAALELERRSEYTAKKRPCMTCSKKFNSAWIGERICPLCKTRQRHKESF